MLNQSTETKKSFINKIIDKFNETTFGKNFNDVSKRFSIRKIIKKASKDETTTIKGLIDIYPKIFGTLITVLIVILVIIINAIYNRFYLKESNCFNLSFFNSSKLVSITNDHTHTVKDYYVKTAYNCCCSGHFKDDYVDKCALENCIKQGARCLDFEIYSLNNLPVVSASSANNYKVKETINTLPIEEVFTIINNTALRSNKGCKNYLDPIFLNFRIMSNNCKMYNNLAKILREHQLGLKLWNRTTCRNGQNLGNVKIQDIKGKVIIMIDATNPLYQHTDLYDLCSTVNGKSNTLMRYLRFNEILNTINNTNLVNFNKHNMSIVLPDTGIYNTNIDFVKAHEYGCQFVGISFQKNDDQLQKYNMLFDNNYSAFSLKPLELRSFISSSSGHDAVGTHPRLESILSTH